MRTIYEDKDLLVIDKSAGVVVDDIYLELNKIHRLDKDTSGILLIAKNEKALIFFQKQFKNRLVEKRYIALVVGVIKNSSGKIETLIGRSKKDGKKQKAYLFGEPGLPKTERKAITEYKVLKRHKNYTLLEVNLKTGRKHQIRCHLAYIGHPIAGDKIYGFKNQLCPAGLNRQFLHSSYIKIKLFNGEYKEFNSNLPEDLKKCLPKNS